LVLILIFFYPVNNTISTASGDESLSSQVMLIASNNKLRDENKCLSNQTDSLAREVASLKSALKTLESCVRDRDDRLVLLESACTELENNHHLSTSSSSSSGLTTDNQQAAQVADSLRVELFKARAEVRALRQAKMDALAGQTDLVGE
jgi:septal ring factor EnvC (AmiA/AmiB activator)